jgi:hypothetical protein
MTTEQVLQEKFPEHQLFNPSESLPKGTDRLSPSFPNCQVEKCLKQLAEKELLGEPYVKDYLYDLKRRNCRLNTLRSYVTAWKSFFSHLKERGRTHPGTEIF